ncbi:MAG TPA: NAD-binding protein [Chloroflexota bacterium]|nr:NAD-binding protein [Chloroflexota bacterium]
MLLDSPLALGGVELRNRTVVAAMTTGAASRTGRPTRRLRAWYEARGAGGAGVVVVEESFVRDDAACRAVRPRHLMLASDAAVPSFRRLATGIRYGGAQPLLQLSYPHVGDLSKLTLEELRGVLRSFVTAGVRAKAAGFAGVQLQAIPSRLLGQLLSPLQNQRRDALGRDTVGRLRAVREVVGGIREACGADFPVLVKLSADERNAQGMTPELAQDVARALEDAGVAGIEVVGGATSVSPTELLSCGVGEATRAELAAAVKAAARVPVLASGRILSPDAAEGVLQRGQADLVALARAALADAAWHAKQRAGIGTEIVPCIGCMACFTPSSDGVIGCPVNGDAGLEHLPPLEAVRVARRVAVVGASLAGLELARVAAARGHDVRLTTAGLPIGGLLGLRAGVPGDAEFGRALLYFGDRLRELGVAISDDAEHGAAVTVDCRPAAERRPRWLNGKGTLAAGELLGRDLHEMYGIGRRVAVIGEGALAAEVALFLAGWGRRPMVVVSTASADPFPDVHPVHAARLRERLEGYKVGVVADARVVQWEYDEDRRSRLIVRRGGRRETLEPFHSAVSAAGWERPGSWPQRVATPRVLREVPDGTTFRLTDTIYPEPLRDQVRFANRLARAL